MLSHYLLLVMPTCICICELLLQVEAVTNSLEIRETSFFIYISKQNCDWEFLCMALLDIQYGQPKYIRVCIYIWLFLSSQYCAFVCDFRCTVSFLHKIGCYAAMKKKIYAMGGGSYGKLFESVECYDPRTQQWTAICPLKERRWAN